MKITTSLSQANSVARNFWSVLTQPLDIVAHLLAAIIDLMINLPVMNAVWRERRELELLNDEHFKDIGLTPDSVRQEMKRSFFDIPQDRKRSYRSTTTPWQSQPF